MGKKRRTHNKKRKKQRKSQTTKPTQSETPQNDSPKARIAISGVVVVCLLAVTVIMVVRLPSDSYTEYLPSVLSMLYVVIASQFGGQKAGK